MAVRGRSTSVATSEGPGATESVAVSMRPASSRSPMSPLMGSACRRSRWTRIRSRRRWRRCCGVRGGRASAGRSGRGCRRRRARSPAPCSGPTGWAVPDPGSGSGAGAWTLELLVSHSRGEGSYQASSRSERNRGADAGTVSSSLTGLYPYGRYMVNERLSVWGVAGYGEGTLTLTPEGQAAIGTAMDLQMGAVGVRGVAVEAPDEGGFELAVTSDAMAVRTASEKTAGLAGADAEVTRLRLGLEGTWRGLAAGGGELVPRLEVGLRHDGGDAETGMGLDIGGGLSWSHPASGLSAELSGRGLLTHESQGFRDRGLSASLGWDPGRGPKLTLAQTVGASASGGMDALLGRGTLEGLARSGPVSMALEFEARRREAANDDGAEPVDALMLRGSMRW